MTPGGGGEGGILWGTRLHPPRAALAHVQRFVTRMKMAVHYLVLVLLLSVVVVEGNPIVVQIRGRM